jgi:hypothetical protein
VDDAQSSSPVTVFDRLTAAGLPPSGPDGGSAKSPGWFGFDDEPVTEPSAPAAPPAHVVLRS